MSQGGGFDVLDQVVYLVGDRGWIRCVKGVIFNVGGVPRLVGWFT